ncbi:DUF58 domain-containing protein [Nocardioides dongxiaopingii]|uniref:DUF58 domain-containing protein n=1 Tax=Nocardioides sp. S-1144 TaxID=2582905 RepID=UPI001163CA76|nr:DUF58 domain-containing protein [Nocardioides sp. S-1144]QDH10811.1 DUF58 domain-containing protein [Nocardioides sp. S-1144]
MTPLEAPVGTPRVTGAPGPVGGTSWRPTGALVRGVVVGLAGLVVAVVAGEPVLLVLTAPVLLTAVPAVLRRPRSAPRLTGGVGHASLHEGQAAEVALRLDDDTDVEQVTRVVAAVPHEHAAPHGGRFTVRLADLARVSLVVSPRRWGSRVVGEERVVLTSGWGGYRWGPVLVSGRRVRVLPTTSYRSRAESPHPRGLVGAHRSTRSGSGTELSGIRPFQPGDRLRRVNWRVSVRTDALHVTTTRAEQDAGLLLVVDLFADHGASGGIDGRASSLDLTVRAAAALAEHATRTGDRVALRPIGGRARSVQMGAGRGHLQRLVGTLAEARTADAHGDEASRLDLRVGAGTTVVLLSPLLVDAVATAAVDLTRRGLPVVVIDTLPPDAAPDAGDSDPRLVDLAWRMRRLEREQVLHALAAAGCPVVAWRGAGTVDEVLRRLSRRRPGGAA